MTPAGIQRTIKNVYFLKFSIFLFFKQFLEDINPFCGPLILLFWTSSDVSSMFQSQSGQPYSHFAEAYILDLHVLQD